MADATRDEAIIWCIENKVDFTKPKFPTPSGWMWADTDVPAKVLTAIFTNTEDEDIESIDVLFRVAALAKLSYAQNEKNKNEQPLGCLGQRCIMLRKQQGITQAELSRRSGISGAAISLLEKGERNPTLTTAVSISNELGVSLDVFAGLKQYKQDDLQVEILELKQKLESIRVLAT